MSLEDVEDSTAALVLPLVIGLPLVLLLVGGTTWMVATRALAPVERIRREVEQITGDRLDRRVPEPPSRDEIHRLARTMNQMLGRLQDSRDRQQQFVSDASHELRSPLASIRQTAEVARTHPGALPEGELADAVLEESARMQRLVEQLLLLTRADEGAITQAHHDVDLDDLALAVARRVRRPGLARRHLRNRARPGSRGPGRRSPRWCRTSSTTPPGTPTQSWPSPSGRPTTASSSSSRTTAPGSPRSTGSASSTGSCGSTRPALVTPAGAVSGWRSSRRSSPLTAGPSRSRRRVWAAPGSSYAFPRRAGRDADLST